VTRSLQLVAAVDVVKSYDGKRVLDGISFQAESSQRLGLVGENGAGKSTLLRLLAGTEEPDSGRVLAADDMGFLTQDLDFPDDTPVGRIVLDGLAPIREALTRLERLAVEIKKCPDDQGVLTAYAAALEWAEVHDAWAADQRADVVLHGLGLGEVCADRRRLVSTLSGGQQARLGLAALLLKQPQALLLDEPTNHLDDSGLTFLEKHLGGLPGAVVVASHDRVFLDAICTEIWDHYPSVNGVTGYGGGYSSYLAAKQLERRRWEPQWVAEQEELTQLRESLSLTSRRVAHGRAPKDNNKASYKAHGERVQHVVSRRVQNAQRRFDELTRTQVRKPRPLLRFNPGCSGSRPGDGPLLQATGLIVPGRLELQELTLNDGDRLLLSGPNGSGESTLLRLLAGTLQPVRGVVTSPAGARVRFLEQEVTFDSRLSPLKIYSGPDTETWVASPLRAVGVLYPRDLTRPVGDLSVGQQRRLGLALALRDHPQVLLLDEPTNHLSLSVVEELEEALGNMLGAVVVASHDRWLRGRWGGSELSLLAGRIREPTRAPTWANRGIDR